MLKHSIAPMAVATARLAYERTGVHSRLHFIFTSFFFFSFFFSSNATACQRRIEACQNRIIERYTSFIAQHTALLSWRDAEIACISATRPSPTDIANPAEINFKIVKSRQDAGRGCTHTAIWCLNHVRECIIDEIHLCQVRPRNAEARCRKSSWKRKCSSSCSRFKWNVLRSTQISERMPNGSIIVQAAHRRWWEI